MSREGLEALRARVDADADLARRLRRSEPEGFADDVRRVAAELGLDVSEADIHAAVARGRQAWMLRWVR